MSLWLKATLFSVVNVVACAAVYWYLSTGGWLTSHYQLNDPNIVNAVPAIFEPIAIISVITYWQWRKSFLLPIDVHSGSHSNLRRRRLSICHSPLHAFVTCENDVAVI